METIALMMVMSVVSSIIGSWASQDQQEREFQQQDYLLNRQQEFTAEREDIAYNRQRKQSVMQDMIAAGVNPNIAAQAIAGGTSETAALGGSPTAPSVPSAIAPLVSMLSQGGQNLYDVWKNQAEINNIQADTQQKEVQTGIMPRDYWLRNLSTYHQIRVWNQQVDTMASEAKVNDERVEMYKVERLNYQRLTDAQIETYKAQVLQSVATAINQLEQSKTEENKRENLDADTVLKGAETSNVIQETSNLIIEGEKTFEQGERERIAKEFEQAIGGIPLTADNQKMIQKWAEAGEYEKIRDFYLNLFAIAKNQSLGESQGKPNQKFGIPFGIWNLDNYQDGVFGRTTMPFWNPFPAPSGSW